MQRTTTKQKGHPRRVMTARLAACGNRSIETGLYSNMAGKTAAYFVSVGQPDFEGNRLKASLALIISQGLETCHVISTGTLQRWNIMSKQNISEAEARPLAHKREEEWITRCKEALMSMAGLEQDDFPDDSSMAISLFSKTTVFVFHRWDDLLKYPEYQLYQKNYQDALLKEKDAEVDERRPFMKARNLTVKNFLRRRTFKTDAEKSRYQSNSESFLNEETPVMPLLYTVLGCQYVFYPNTCLALFQHAYVFYFGEKEKYTEIWRQIRLQTVLYADADIAALASYFKGESTLYTESILKKHLDTASELLPEARKISNDAVSAARPLSFFHHPAISGLDVKHEEGSLDLDEAISTLECKVKKLIAYDSLSIKDRLYLAKKIMNLQSVANQAMQRILASPETSEEHDDCTQFDMRREREVALRQ